MLNQVHGPKSNENEIYSHDFGTYFIFLFFFSEEEIGLVSPGSNIEQRAIYIATCR